MDKKFDSTIADTQATAVESIKPEGFDFERYDPKGSASIL